MYHHCQYEPGEIRVLPKFKPSTEKKMRWAEFETFIYEWGGRSRDRRVLSSSSFPLSPPTMSSLLEYFDFSQPSFYFALANILFNPIYWNIVARAGKNDAFVNVLNVSTYSFSPLEYRSHILTKLAGGHAYRGCAALAISIFSLGILRDYLYKAALEFQPIHPLLELDAVKAIAVVLFLSGNVLVLSSMWALGFTGTYLGKTNFRLC